MARIAQLDAMEVLARRYGATDEEVCEALGTPSKYYVPVKDRKGRQRGSPRMDMAADLFVTRCMTLEQIGQEMGVSKQCIASYLSRAGLTSKDGRRAAVQSQRRTENAAWRRDRAMIRAQLRAAAAVHRFWNKVDASAGEHECWPWTGCLNPVTGYGQARWFGEGITAHRLALRACPQSIPPAPRRGGRCMSQGAE